MWTYPWDVIDEGVDRVFGIFENDMGLDAASISAAYHNCDCLRTHMPGKKIYSSYDDSIYFQPQIELYRDTVLKPNVHPMSKERNTLRVICEAGDRHGIEVIAWTLAMHNHYLARQYPECAIQGVFGDRYPGTLCPANPQVRQYMRALSTDLDANYDLAAIELESLDYGGYRLRNNPKVGVELGPVGSYLMSLCFCEACGERARDSGVDLEALRARAEKLLLECFDNGSMGGDLDEFKDDPLVQGFESMRVETVTSLVRELRETVKTPVSFIYMGGSGVDQAAIEAITDRSNALFYGDDPERVRAAVEARIDTMADPGMLIAGLSASNMASAELMKEILMAAYEGGARRFSYYAYSMTPRRQFKWIGEAVSAVRTLDAGSQ